MEIVTYAPSGYEGELVNVETDIRRGIPGFEIVGLPDGAVREARERVRVALKNCGFIFPQNRILVNLSPADVRKEGASFDLPIALSLLSVSGQIPVSKNKLTNPVLVLGELQLSGKVRGVKGVLPAVSAAFTSGVKHCIVPEANIEEAAGIGEGYISGINTLTEAVISIIRYTDNSKTGPLRGAGIKYAGMDRLEMGEDAGEYEDFKDIKGQIYLKRALEVAAAGMHNLFLFGPPGSGKTMAARRFPSILPNLTKKDSVEVTKIYSVAGKLSEGSGLVTRPPFRSPHHSSSLEGIVGGGKGLKAGEISLAHKGVLLLDEAPEFKKSLLQALREPLEDRKIDLARVGQTCWFPADFQVILTANPCPCGNLGLDNCVCLCSSQEIHRYWKKLGSALLDRIDIRVPVSPVTPANIFDQRGEKSRDVRRRVFAAFAVQEKRYKDDNFKRNARIPPGLVGKYCALTSEGERDFERAVKKLFLSSRACHSILKIARTIADLAGEQDITSCHIFEAVQHRRYGEKDYYWNPL